MLLEAAYFVFRVSLAASLPQHIDHTPPLLRRDNPASLTGWTEAPDRRGTLDLLLTCLLTLSLCVWSALHLNIPAVNEKGRLPYLRFVKWAMIGIVAPELVLGCAWIQHNTATNLGIKLNAIWEEEKKRTGVSYTTQMVRMSNVALIKHEGG
jgi:hypothetical protein